MTGSILDYVAVVLSIALASVGTGIGQGMAAAQALSAIDRQEFGRSHVFRTVMLGLVLCESACIFALIISIILFGSIDGVTTVAATLCRLGAALAIGVSACAVGIASSYAVSASCVSVSRQPFYSQRIMTLMLISQTIIEAPVIFAFIFALIIKGSIY